MCVVAGAVSMLPDRDGPTHAHMLSAATAWSGIARSRTGSHSSPGRTRSASSRISSTASRPQHAANPDRRNRQSVAVHLMSLCWLERGFTGRERREGLGSWVGREYPVLEPRPAATRSPSPTSVAAPAAERPSTVERLGRSAYSMSFGGHRASGASVPAWLQLIRVDVALAGSTGQDSAVTAIPSSSSSPRTR